VAATRLRLVYIGLICGEKGKSFSLYYACRGKAVGELTALLPPAEDLAVHAETHLAGIQAGDLQEDTAHDLNVPLPRSSVKSASG